MSQVLIPHTALEAKGITYSKPHLWRLEKFHKDVDAGKAEKTSVPLFPLRVPIGPSRYGYVEEEIDAYVAELIANRSLPMPGMHKPGKRKAAARAADVPL
jgi:prophage regulatory protein